MQSLPSFRFSTSPVIKHEKIQERANLDVARKIYTMRIAAGLSQADLARRIGTTQSVISRLEDADYDGHSMAMLTRISDSLEKRVEIHFVNKRSRLQPA